MTDEKRDASRNLWDDMAGGWEQYREFMRNATGHVAKWLVNNVEPRDGDTILDLAGGPGDNGMLAAERVGSGKVIETDFAPKMVEVAARNVADRGLANVETRVLDAERMDLADDSVDGIICRWGFMLMLDPQTAMKECRRVLRDGRRLSLSVWAGPAENPWVTVTGMTLVQLGHQPSGDPFGPGGMFSMAEHDKIGAMLKEAGFDNVTFEDMPVEWKYGSFDEAWTFWTRLAGAVAALVKNLPPDEVARLRAALEEAVQPYRASSGEISLPGLTINAVAS
jgi:SAM-dependent methyltransferase